MSTLPLNPFWRTNLKPFLSSLYTILQTLFFIPFIFISKRFKYLGENFLKSRKSADPNCTKSRTKLQLPPGLAPWPIIGNIPEMLLNKPTFRWIHTLMKQFQTHIFCLRLGNTHVITVSCPKIAREVLKQQDSVFASRPLTFAQGLISSNNLTTVLSPYGDQWKKMKRVLVTQILSPARHRLFHHKRSEEADNLLTYVHNLSKESKNVNLRIVTRYYSGNVIRRLMFSKRHFGKTTVDGGPGVEELEHVEALFTSLGYLYAFCVSDFLPGLVGLDIDGQEKILKEANDIVDKYHDPIVNERIKLWRVDGESNGEREVDDFLDVLISLHDNNGKPLLTHEEIRAQSKEIMLAAVDNPSNAVEWVIAEMLNQPDILQKATEEIDTVVGKNRLVQESDIPKLSYIKSCIREAFRLHPIAPFNVPHESLTDTTVAGYFIPKGSWVMLSRIGLGRNPTVWVDPLEFKPERHLNECSVVALTEHDLRFVSFSTGRRGCIAATLGTCMTTMLLARLLQGFTWSLPEDTARVDLSESVHDLFMAKPLTARAEPRLPLSLYPEVY